MKWRRMMRLIIWIRRGMGFTRVRMMRSGRLLSGVLLSTTKWSICKKVLSLTKLRSLWMPQFYKKNRTNNNCYKNQIVARSKLNHSFLWSTQAQSRRSSHLLSLLWTSNAAHSIWFLYCHLWRTLSNSLWFWIWMKLWCISIVIMSTLEWDHIAELFWRKWPKFLRLLFLQLRRKTTPTSFWTNWTRTTSWSSTVCTGSTVLFMGGSALKIFQDLGDNSHERSSLTT